LNHVSAYSFAHGKTSSGKWLQRATYDDLRGQFGLPAQMACNVPRQVGATYQALWTKARKNAEARRLGYTKRRWKRVGPGAPLRLAHPCLQSRPRLLDSAPERRVSILPLAGRVHVPYQGWSRHVALMQEGATIGGAKLWYDRGKQRFFLLVSLTLQTPYPTPEGTPQVLGVDVGQRYLATVATLDNRAQFYSGKEIRAKADHYARLQKRLRAARHSQRYTAAYRHWRGRRDGGPLNTNHTISKRILGTHPHACIGLEELSGIRDRTKRKHGKKATKKQRRANRHASKWAIALAARAARL
jgi:putative transposase